MFPERTSSEIVQAVWFASALYDLPAPKSRWLRGKAYTAVVLTIKGRFELAGKLQPVSPVVIPAYTESTRITLHPGTALIGICFPPGVSTTIFGKRVTDPTELYSLDSYLPWQSLEQSLTASDNHWRQALVLYRWIDRWLDPYTLPDTLSETLTEIEHLAGQEKLDQIRPGVSFRQIERQFKHYIGVSPKYYQRILRVNRVLQQLRLSPESNLTEIAYQQGYSDQAHMSREFKAFNHITPREYCRYLKAR
nr:helix-turn-helix domain-containing protein [Oceanospirillum sediminis]